MHKFIISGMLLIGLFYSVTIFAVKDRIIDKEIIVIQTSEELKSKQNLPYFMVYHHKIQALRCYP